MALVFFGSPGDAKPRSPSPKTDLGEHRNHKSLLFLYSPEFTPVPQTVGDASVESSESYSVFAFGFFFVVVIVFGFSEAVFLAVLKLAV